MKVTSFGDKVKEARVTAGLSKKEAAAKAEWCWNQWHDYESGRKLPSVVVAFKIADVLGVRLDDLRPSEDFLTNPRSSRKPASM